MSLVSKLVQGTSFAQFTDFVSPAFFQVMPVRQLFVQTRALVSSYRDASAFAHALGERREALQAAKIDIAIGDPVHEGSIVAPSDTIKKALGQQVLTLYFHQLHTRAPALLDLGRKRFTQRDGKLVWSPGAGDVRWDEQFRTSICDVYRAFYGHGNLQQALEPLHLASAAPIFEQHFGEGDAGTVTFSVDHFVSSFHAIFVHCRDNGIALHPNFLPLGLYLASTYETLERLGVALDVRTAYAQGRQC